MARIFAGVAGGLVMWVIAATLGNLLLRAAWPGYALVEVTMHFTLAMLLARLLLGALSSLCAGFVAAWIAKRNGTTVNILAGLLLVGFVPVHYSMWPLFPIWYHLIFLVSLVAVTVLGAMCYAKYVAPRRERLANPGRASQDTTT